MLPTTFAERFLRLFVPASFEQLARESGWLKRRRKIDPGEFLTALIFGQLSASRPTLSSQVQGLAVAVTRQAVAQRFNPAAVVFLQRAFAQILARTLAWAPAQPQAAALRAQFSALYLLDSTSFDCPASLRDHFPGCGGAGSAANVKVLLRYEVINGQLEPLCVLPGKRSDQGQALAMAERLHAGELQLQDKGFFDSKAWQAAQARGAYLLMPLPHAVTLWLIPAAGTPEIPLDLAAALAASDAAQVDWPALWLGQPGHRAGPVRLVAFRRSPESAARHRQGLRESMRTQGRTPSAKAMQLAGWLLLVTNAPAAKLPTTMLSYLYRLRWQIELIFRQLKSVLRLHQTESADIYRVQCEIWARLSGAVLLFWWHSHANAECWRRHACELSFEKLIRLLQHWGLTLAQAFLTGPAAVRRLVHTLGQQLLRNARKGRQKNRPTSWENLAGLWPSEPAANTTN